MSIKVSSRTVAAKQVKNTKKKKVQAMFLHGYPNSLCDIHDHLMKLWDIKTPVSHIVI